jgi:phytanoyl-CoA hydroxylase
MPALFPPDTPVSFAPDLIARYREQGFVQLPGFLDAEEVALVRAELARFITHVVPRMPASEVFYEAKGDQGSLKQLQRMFQWDDFFERLFLKSRFFALAEHLLGRPALGKNMHYFNKPSGIGAPTPAHQDGYYWKITPMEGLTMWLALEDVDEENGCVRYVPGSHRRGFRPHAKTGTLGFSQGITDFSEADTAAEACMRAGPGDLIVHDAHTIHRADGNRSATRTRQALGFIYFSARAREDTTAVRDYQANLTREMVAAGKL